MKSLTVVSSSGRQAQVCTSDTSTLSPSSAHWGQAEKKNNPRPCGGLQVLEDGPYISLNFLFYINNNGKHLYTTYCVPGPVVGASQQFWEICD